MNPWRVRDTPPRRGASIPGQSARARFVDLVALMATVIVLRVLRCGCFATGRVGKNLRMELCALHAAEEQAAATGEDCAVIRLSMRRHPRVRTSPAVQR